MVAVIQESKYFSDNNFQVFFPENVCSVKITFTSNFRQPCGIADYSNTLIKELQFLVDVEIVELIVPDEFSGFPLNYIRNAQHYFKLGQELNGGDICHIQHEYAFWGGYFPRFNAFPFFRAGIKVPIVMTVHELIDPPYEIFPQNSSIKSTAARLFYPLINRYENYVNFDVFNCAQKLIVHTEDQRNILAARGVREDRLAVVPHGIPSLDVIENPQTFLEKFGLAGKRFISLIGFISRRKGYEAVLEILPELPHDVYFVIAGGARTKGDQIYEDQLRARIASQGLTGRVVFTGYLERDELAAVLTASEVVVAPFEKAFGSGSLSLALAAGKPIVASDIKPTKDLQRESGGLLLFDRKNSGAFLTQVNRLLADRLLRESLAASAEKYAQGHSFQRISEAIVSLYREVLSYSQYQP